MTISLPMATPDLQFHVTPNETPLSAPERQAVLDNPIFGTVFTDHMVDICWSEKGGWHRPRVQPYGPIPLDPAASVLHYGQEIFEGMKAYSQPDGSICQLSCDAVILACNGFGGNVDMVKQHLPAMKDAQYAGHVGNDGSAIAWGLQLGAELADMGAYQGHGSWAIPQGSLISWALMMEGGIQINRFGARFHDETQGYSEAAVQVLNQPDGVAWTVFDNQLLQFAQDFPDFVAAQAAGAVKSAANAESLSAIVGCPAIALDKTMAEVNQLAEANALEKSDAKDRWGRSFKRRLEAPFHAIKVTGALFHTQGGLNINAQCQVLQPNGKTLPNLYAAGGAARGVSGAEVWGYLSGNGLLSAIAGGHIAAHAVAQKIRENT